MISWNHWLEFMVIELINIKVARSIIKGNSHYLKHLRAYLINEKMGCIFLVGMILVYWALLMPRFKSLAVSLNDKAQNYVINWVRIYCSSQFFLWITRYPLLRQTDISCSSSWACGTLAYQSLWMPWSGTIWDGFMYRMQQGMQIPFYITYIGLAETLALGLNEMQTDLPVNA